MNWLEVIDCGYFERVWPLQETALSQHTTLVCGHATISFAAARFAIDFMKPFWMEMATLQYDSLDSPTVGQEHPGERQETSAELVDPFVNSFGLRHSGYHAHELLTHVSSWGVVRNIWTDQSKWVCIEQLLQINANLRASKVVDKVYSLYSVFSRIFEDFPKPDSKRPEQHLWILTTLSIINSFRTLDLIASIWNDDRCSVHRSELYCSTQECRGTMLARWCYRWNSEATRAYMDRPFSFFETNLPRNTAWDRSPGISFGGANFDMHEASNVLEPVQSKHLLIPDRFDNVSLRLQGQLIANITETSPRPLFLVNWLFGRSGKKWWRRDDNFYRDMTLSFLDWFDMIKSVYTSEVDAHHVLRNFLLWERNSPVIDTSLEAFAKWWTFLKSSFSAASIFNVRVGNLEATDTGRYHAQLCNFERFRRLFLTSDRKVGKTVYAVEVDDLVVLPCWSRMPVVLRPVKDCDRVLSGRKLESARYLLIGFAYIEGLMDCNDWKLQEANLAEFSIL